jgi:hypothetical protein
MLPQKAVIPKHYFAEVVQRVVDYAEATGNMTQATEWRQKLAELGDATTPRREVASRPEGHNAASTPPPKTNQTPRGNDTVGTAQHKEGQKQP